jgi:hypothetical protein
LRFANGDAAGAPVSGRAVGLVLAHKIAAQPSGERDDGGDDRELTTE